MGSKKIRVLIVDDVAETRENVSKLLLLEDDIQVVGEAGNGEEAISLSRSLQPDVVLMDINMPVMDGITATEKLTMEMPQVGIIIMSVQGEQEYLRKAMMAGAREYLIKPPSGDDLVATIRRVYEVECKRRLSQGLPPDGAKTVREPGRVITVFSTKGGVGKSIFAVNLAVSLQQVSKRRVVLLDLDLQFGDVAMLLDLLPKRSIADLVSEMEHMDKDLVEAHLIEHDSGVRVLPAPLRPEYAEIITGRHIEAIINILKDNYDYIIVDTCQSFQDTILAALDASDLIYMLTTLDVPTIKNIKLGLDVMASLHYGSDRIKLILNRSTAEMGVSVRDLTGSVPYTVACQLPSEGKVVVGSINRGIPFVQSDPKSPISQAIFELAQQINNQFHPGKGEPAKQKTPWFSRSGR
ncbi:MAG TPA: MinD/ParA family protein [Firmicutes bacterium]|nr:MinD/ParA family protein [Bacillota bacterium]HOQ23108.1 response regulator [Bacillota bacterium]HPT67005.1 response regulator [Bacillota bacterium]